MDRRRNHVLVANINGRSISFKINDASTNATEATTQLFKENWRAVLPSQDQHDNTRFKWASGYHRLDQKLTVTERSTLHCFCSSNNYYNRGFLYKISKEKSNREFDPDDYETFEISDQGSVTRYGEIIGMVEPEVHPDVHPAFQNRCNNSLFHCLADAVDIHLKDERVAEQEGVAELIDIVKASGLQHKVYTPSTKSTSDERPVHDAKKKPFIVVEGLDATGKSTLTKRLASRLGAEILNTPPPVISHLRESFDTRAIHSILMRKVYYAIGNYIPASTIQETLLHKPVIMDRFWHSTAAYAIATECESGDGRCLPPEGHWVYEWPVDLCVPDLVVLLTVSEKVRTQRIEARNMVETEEEKHLAQSLQFRQRVLGAYRRIVGPPVVEIDASGSEEEVEHAVIATLRERN